MPIDELLAAPRAKVRKWSPEEVGSHTRGRGVTERALVPEPLPREMLMVTDFAPSSAMGGMPHLPGTREYFTCLEGTVNIMVAGNRFRQNRRLEADEEGHAWADQELN